MGKNLIFFVITFPRAAGLPRLPQNTASFKKGEFSRFEYFCVRGHWEKKVKFGLWPLCPKCNILGAAKSTALVFKG